MADAAGLLNPKLKPVVDADVVAGVPDSNKQTNPILPGLYMYYIGFNQDP